MKSPVGNGRRVEMKELMGKWGGGINGRGKG